MTTTEAATTLPASTPLAATEAPGPLKCMNVDQPYAWAIAEGLKGWETRGTRTNHRGLLAVRSTKNLRPFWEIWDEGHQVAYTAAAKIVQALMPLELDVLEDEPLPLGCVAAVVEVVDCLPITDVWPESDGQHIRFERGVLHLYRGHPHHEPYEGDDITDQLPWGDWRPGRWAYELANVRQLAEPVPAPGAMPGVFTLPADVEAAVRAQLGEAVAQ